MQSAKNFGLSPAATDLGLGDMVRQQVEDAEVERKKKLLRDQNGTAGAYGSDILGPASLALLGQVGGY